MKSIASKILLVALTVALPQLVFAVESRTGFIGSEIWTNDVSYLDGAEVILYTSVFNGESEKLDLVINFYDQEELLGDREVFIEPDSSQTVSIGWQLSQGDHEVHAQISSAIIAGDSVSLKLNKTKKEKIKVAFNLQQAIDDQKQEIENTVEDKFDSISEKDLPPVVEDAVVGAEEIREDISEVLGEAVERLEEEAELIPEGESTLLNKIKSVAARAGVFVADHRLLFYIVAILAAFLVLKFVFKLLRRIFRKLSGSSSDED
jgi:hypothetical protein